MALFEYFPNYVWNLSLAISLESGGRIGEIVDMCAPIKDAANKGEDAGTLQFMEQWVKMADKLIGLAAEDEEKGRLFSAAAKLKRAALYLFTAERMQGHGHPGRAETFAKAQNAFTKSISFSSENCERVEIALEEGVMPALFVRAEGEGPRPCVV